MDGNASPEDEAAPLDGEATEGLDVKLDLAVDAVLGPAVGPAELIGGAVEVVESWLAAEVDGGHWGVLSLVSVVGLVSKMDGVLHRTPHLLLWSLGGYRDGARLTTDEKLDRHEDGVGCLSWQLVVGETRVSSS